MTLDTTNPITYDDKEVIILIREDIMEKRYVTFNENQDICNLCETLTHDKDYLVLDDDGFSFKVTSDTGLELWVCKTYFYPPELPEEILPAVKGTIEESFDNLVRSDYVLQEGDYFKLDTLSEEQREFLSKELPTYNSSTFTPDNHYRNFVNCYFNKNKQFNKCNIRWCTGKQLSFNDLFVEKDELCEKDPFENLVYVAPKKDSYIRIETLSQEQKEFLDSNLEYCDDDALKDGCWQVLGFMLDEGSEWVCCNTTSYTEEIFFNDIFKEKGNLS